MSEFAVNTTRYDPYKPYRFVLTWSGRRVAGFSKVSALKRATEVIRKRDGGDPAGTHLAPGQTTYDALTLERGVTHDPDFEAWANAVWDYKNSTGAASLNDFRKDVVIELYNEAGQVALTYHVRNCWPSELVALPELDTEGNALAIQSLVLQNEGWERVEAAGA